MPQFDVRIHRLCAWSGVLFTALFFVGFAIAGFLTPPAPNDSPEQVAAMYRDNTDAIRIGLLIATVGSALVIVWVAEISIQMYRIEGRFSVLALGQAIAGACLVLEFLFPLLCWQNAAYRPERAPEDVQMLNDLGWLPFLGIACTAVMQGWLLGIAILRDRREIPLFPRWAGYFSIWAVSMFAPASLVVTFHDGPLAYNGIISWWLAVVTFFLWMVGVTYVLLKAINAQAVEGATSSWPANGGRPEAGLAAEVSALRAQVERLQASA